MRVFIVVLGVALVALHAAPARALMQPNGAAIPSQMGCSGAKPTGLLPVFACACTQPGVCNVGAPCASATTCDNGQHGTCESTLWHSFNDNTCIPSNHSGLDPWTSAAITPETFHPTCALTYTVLSRGTARFKSAFGWYNAGTSAPPASDLHVMLDCNSAAGASVVLDLSKEPAWKGGDVGFFLVTPEDHGAAGQCAGGNCCGATTSLTSGAGYVYYSQRELNPDGQGASPYIHLLIYPSTIAPQKYYFGWEDTFQTASADFTDLVASVTGVECSGAGVQCSTGQPGACALGVTECGTSAQVSCQPVVKPSPEKCNGVDDDCNGAVDDGATCPAAGEVCDNGKCVPHCGGTEFPCFAGTACDPPTGLCVDPKCIGVACSGGQICRAGQCGTPCSGVVCPHGQSCVGSACVDLCSGVACPAGQVCAGGGCVPACSSCGGLTCASPLACDSKSGACADPSCPSGCAAGTHCQVGACVDDCSGVKCPSGQACQAGKCTASGPGDGGGGITGPGEVDGGRGAGSADAGAGGNAASGGGNAGGCACRGSGGGAGSAPLAIGVFAALALLRHRRRGRARP